MTLAQLKFNIESANLQGMAPLSTAQLEVYQQMAFDWICKLCEPLNLLIGYQDTGIYRSLGDGWFLKKPIIAQSDDEYIDIDDRLDLAFIYIIIHFIGVNDNAIIKRNEASRLALEYSIDINELGYSKAKRVYEQESFITVVKFDCFGKFYEVCEDFVKTVIDCILCKGVCMRADEHKQLEKYKTYLNGVVNPNNREKMRAIDNAVFVYLMSDVKRFSSYSAEELGSVTTRFEELCKISTGESVADDVIALDKRLMNSACCGSSSEMKRCVDEY